MFLQFTYLSTKNYKSAIKNYKYISLLTVFPITLFLYKYIINVFSRYKSEYCLFVAITECFLANKRSDLSREPTLTILQLLHFLVDQDQFKFDFFSKILYMSKQYRKIISLIKDCNLLKTILQLKFYHVVKTSFPHRHPVVTNCQTFCNITREFILNFKNLYYRFHACKFKHIQNKVSPFEKINNQTLNIPKKLNLGTQKKKCVILM